MVDTIGLRNPKNVCKIVPKAMIELRADVKLKDTIMVVIDVLTASLGIATPSPEIVFDSLKPLRVKLQSCPFSSQIESKSRVILQGFLRRDGSLLISTEKGAC
ncbi:hypothetical protein Tco_0064315 [Tanacetum coccineum]